MHAFRTYTIHPEFSVAKDLGSVICHKIELLKNRSQIRHAISYRCPCTYWKEGLRLLLRDGDATVLATPTFAHARPMNMPAALGGASLCISALMGGPARWRLG